VEGVREAFALELKVENAEGRSCRWEKIVVEKRKLFETVFR